MSLFLQNMGFIQTVYHYKINETGKTNKNVNDFLTYYSKSIYIFKKKYDKFLKKLSYMTIKYFQERMID